MSSGLPLGIVNPFWVSLQIRVYATLVQRLSITVSSSIEKDQLPMVKIYFRLFAIVVTMLMATSAMAQIQFGEGVTYSCSTPGDPQEPFYVKVGDLDNDGYNDVVTGNHAGIGSSHGGYVNVLYGNGDGTLTIPQKYRSVPVGNEGIAGTTFGVEICDLNGDGKKDIVATNILNPEKGLAVLINQGGRNFTLAQTLPTDAYPGGIVVADFDGQNGPDVAVPCYTGQGMYGHVLIFLNDGNGSLVAVPSYI